MSAPPKKHELSEEDIKLRYITPAISSKWNPHTQMRMEYYFTDGRIMVLGNHTARGKPKFADYLLFYQDNMPLAVVEAKDNNHPLGGGLQQAKEYAQILDVPFANCSNGDVFMEHDFFTGTESEIPLDQFPTPEELWQIYKTAKNINCECTPHV